MKFTSEAKSEAGFMVFAANPAIPACRGRNLRKGSSSHQEGTKIPTPASDPSDKKRRHLSANASW